MAQRSQDWLQRYYHDVKLRDLRTVKSIVAELQGQIDTIYNGAKLCLFGSSVSGFAAEDCDVDTCLWFPPLHYRPNDRHDQQHSSDILRKIYSQLNHGGPFEPKMFTSDRAAVPIVKCCHKETERSIDININMIEAILSSHLLRQYSEYDERIDQLGLLIKQWAKSKGICHPQRGSIDSISWVLMVIFYLQQDHAVGLSGPVAPVLRPRNGQSWDIFPGAIGGMTSEIQSLYEGRKADLFSASQNVRGRNSQTIFELIKGFFAYYNDFDFTRSMIDVRTGKVQPKSSSDPVFIQEPVHGSNTAPSVSDFPRIVAALRETHQHNNEGKGYFPNDLPTHSVIDIVLTYNSNNYPIRINANSTVGDLKQKVKDKTSIHPSQQHLTSSSRALQNDSARLQSCGITNGAKIMMAGRSRGGGGGLTY